jgi:hypothetical protein
MKLEMFLYIALPLEGYEHTSGTNEATSIICVLELWMVCGGSGGGGGGGGGGGSDDGCR